MLNFSAYFIVTIFMNSLYQFKIFFLQFFSFKNIDMANISNYFYYFIILIIDFLINNKILSYA